MGADAVFSNPLAPALHRSRAAAWVLAALALGVEKPEPGIMDKPPRKASEHAITASLLLRAYPFLGMIQSLAAMAAFAAERSIALYFVTPYGPYFDFTDDELAYLAGTAGLAAYRAANGDRIAYVGESEDVAVCHAPLS